MRCGIHLGLSETCDPASLNGLMALNPVPPNMVGKERRVGVRKQSMSDILGQKAFEPREKLPINNVVFYFA